MRKKKRAGRRPAIAWQPHFRLFFRPKRCSFFPQIFAYLVRYTHISLSLLFPGHALQVPSWSISTPIEAGGTAGRHEGSRPVQTRPLRYRSRRLHANTRPGLNMCTFLLSFLLVLSCEPRKTNESTQDTEHKRDDRRTSRQDVNAVMFAEAQQDVTNVLSL